jgi:hypothetical protein
MNFPGVFYSGQIQNEYVPVTGWGRQTRLLSLKGQCYRLWG